MIIQVGAIAAVVWHYRIPFFSSIKPALSFKGPLYEAWLKIVLAFVPAAIVGVLFASKIKAYLFGVAPVAYALIIGGIAMIIIERILPNTRESTPQNGDAEAKTQDLETLSSKVTLKQAIGIGCFQCLALWPGTSRSMSTILGGRILGLNTKYATEFSFWLAIPTLVGAGAWDLLRHYEEFLVPGTLLPLITATIVSFVCALVVIRIFLGFIKKHSLEVFGWYRIAIGVLLYIFIL